MRKIIRQKYLEQKRKPSQTADISITSSRPWQSLYSNAFQASQRRLFICFPASMRERRTDEANKSQSHDFDIITRPKPHSNKLFASQRSTRCEFILVQLITRRNLWCKINLELICFKMRFCVESSSNDFFSFIQFPGGNLGLSDWDFYRISRAINL